MSRFNNIEQLTAERRRLERRSDAIGHKIKSRYLDIKDHPLGNSRFAKILRIASRFRYLLPLFLRRKQK